MPRVRKRLMKNWVEYYDSGHSIYVNSRHRDIHYARLADTFALYVPSDAECVLDYGCGEALHADRVAAVSGKLILAEAGPVVRSRLTARFKDNSSIAVISTDEAAALPRQSLDMIIMNSVSQYLPAVEFTRIAALFHSLLKPEGLLLVGDVVPPAASVAAETFALLKFGWQSGFFAAAIAGLARTFFSDYSLLRNKIGFTRYSENEMTASLTASGFIVTRAHVNVGHLTTRMTFLARKENAAKGPLQEPAGKA